MRVAKECWAASLKDCDGGLSAEHTVSKSLFVSDFVDVYGFDWCKDKPKRVGLNSLVKNCLCRRHNSKLSILDGAASHAFRVLREQTKLSNDRVAQSRQKFKRKIYSVNAKALERWLLKTTINFGYGGKYPIGATGIRPGYPSDNLVRIAFGLEGFDEPNGMKVGFKVGLPLRFYDTVGFYSMIKDNKYVAGARFTFRGMYFFLDLIPGGLAVDFREIDGIDETWHDLTLSRRFNEMNAEYNGKTSHTVRFRWND